MKKDKCGAFNDAIALESIHDELHDAGVDSDLLIKYARTVAYKVFHNLKHGYEMDKKGDPLTVGGIPANEVWAENYNS